MAGYIVRRLLQAIPVLLGTTFLIYFMVFAMPGDPIVALFGEKTPPPQVLEQVRERYNLDQPFIVQYLLFLGGIFRGDFGISFSGQPVSNILAATFPVTLRLALLAIFIEMVAGITIGLISGLRKGGIFDASALVVSLILISLPVFVVAFVAQFIFGIQLGWFRTTVGTGAPMQDLILPAIVLATISFAQITRLTRASVIETDTQDFVRTAASKGLSRRRIVPVHILRNSLIPVVTYLAVDFGVLMVGATVTEGIFNVPGVGRTLYQAIIRGEGPTVVSFVTVMVLIYLVINLLVDLLYAVLDPRIRYAK
ncbi:oligopeptide transport system permease protein [Agromyces flavus]|uniref:Oligopeptide transport system permease protein n=1 Tax=Agromyces flavus TaxID=589382 RepID=A0A1H1NEE7_9MICO|nr:ABC transporter permease [Agromyces flavus]MCP2369107.1 oligopeptide transport system permease protein [Agromyces flavus]GGI48587.1 peptide ABC transporter [Agromyces flavus]SDR97366.1 oligopeptide transport system permease protein [Agromyces flavus]